MLRPSFCLDEEVGVEQIFAVIAQGFAIGLADARPCGLADGMARCRVPLHRWGEAGIKVCLSLGDEAEFQAGTRADHINSFGMLGFEVLNERLGVGIQMRPARHDGWAFEPRRMDGSGGEGVSLVCPCCHDGAPCSCRTADIERPRNGHEDDAQNRDALTNEGDIDRKFAIALDKFLSAIERIDYPQFAPGLSFGIRRLAALFAEQGNPRAGKGACDDFMAAAVSERKRTVVSLSFHLPFRLGAVIDFHDGLASLDGGADDER